MWITLILMVISTIVSIMFRPVPVPPAAAGFADLQVPVATAGAPIPVIFGTVLIKNPNVVWFGDLTANPIPTPPQADWGSKG